MANEFSDNRISKYAELTAVWTIANQPIYTEIFMQTNDLSDEIDLLQLGQEWNTEFETFNFGPSYPSGQSIWPTKEDPRLYKFNSMWLELDKEHQIIQRQTYSLLEWLGDVGGLFDGL